VFLAHVDHVAMFVGNKLFYFTQSEIQQFRQEQKNGYTLLYLPNFFYEKSLVFKNWCNYYGDINFGLNYYRLKPVGFMSAESRCRG
jgi:hypothetical protein